jgi:tryptophanyl-tRNA synthetase
MLPSPPAQDADSSGLRMEVLASYLNQLITENGKDRMAAEKKLRILSGIQPSGELHIGNYFGMMKRMISYQERGELFCFIVNLHSLTSVFNGESLRQGTISAAMDFLALGLDPERSFFWVQSDVPEHVELSWYLSNFTPVGLLQRAHSYKDKVAQGLPANAGLFTYPVLQAADILLYQTDVVPVGKDQKQHVEMTRDIAIRFNNTYGEVFNLPDPDVEESVAVIPGIDGRKMSKSYGNAIYIFEDKKSLKSKVMSIVTDSTPVEAPKDPDTCSLFALYKLFGEEEAVIALAQRYRAGGLRYVDVKKELLELIWNCFEPFREQRTELENDSKRVIEILDEGAKKARSIARETIEKVRDVTGVRFRPKA